MTLSRNAQLLKYFAQQSRGIPRKHLVKMAYVADLVARQYLGHAISDFNYVVHYFGPYPQEAPDAIAELEREGLAWTQVTGRTDEHDVSFKKLFDNGKRTLFPRRHRSRQHSLRTD